jgi:Glycosyl transferases group 1
MCPPRAHWITDRGFVDEKTKRGEIARAAALVQLSTNESLSLVALEAWQAGVPVIGHRDCLVVREQIRKSSGGRVIGDYAEFAAALDSLWSQPDYWKAMGKSGQRFVQQLYESQERFGQTLIDAIDSLAVPLVEQLRRRGLARARQFGFSPWSHQWSKLIGRLLRQPRMRRRLRLTVEPQVEQRSVHPDVGTTLVPVRVRNEGKWPAAATGPGRAVLEYVLADEGGKTNCESRVTRLPVLLPPGQMVVVVVPVAVPARTGRYRVHFTAGRPHPRRPRKLSGRLALELVVTSEASQNGAGPIEPFLNSAQRLLVEAHALKQLPDDYQDVTQGFLAKWKRAAKQKLLHQFRRAYLDVLSRQQSAFNEKMLVLLSQLVEGCGALNQAVPLPRLLRQTLREQRRLRRDLGAIRQRLECLEQNSLTMSMGEGSHS